MKKRQLLILLLTLPFIIKCVEPFESATQNFENSLIVQATITNELKNQHVKLGRTYPLEEKEPKNEINASVKVIDNLNNEYLFKGDTLGNYYSINKFAAIADREYQLKITTSDNKAYQSLPTKLTPLSTNLNIEAKKHVNDEGIEGIIILANSIDPTGNSKYYRFSYEETHKIIAPYWSPLDAFGVSPLPTVTPSQSYPFYHEVYTLPRTKEERVCYKTTFSNSILLEETNKYAEDKVTNYPILFIPKSEYKLTHRYSILVHQRVQSFKGYSFYNTLNKLSGQSNIFSQNQPGFINGNLVSTSNPEEKVIGFFEVSSSLSDRIFFAFEDYFPNEPKPKYFTECDVITPDLDDKSYRANPEFSPLITSLFYYGMKFYDFNPPALPPMHNNPYKIVKKECSDCTSVGSNIKPTFWVD